MTGGSSPTPQPGGGAGWGRSRGVSTLLALVTAITVLTIVLTGTLVIVEDSFRDTQRGDAERSLAIGASDRLVAADGPIADRPNVLDAEALEAFDDADLRELGASDRFAMAVSVDGERVADVGDPSDGHVIRRIVQIEHSETIERTPALGSDGENATTLPVRTDGIELSIAPSAGENVTAVRSNGRVVLLDDDGLGGTHEIETSRYETLDLAFETNGTLETGDVSVTYDATNRERATIAVTVQDVTSVTARGESA